MHLRGQDNTGQGDAGRRNTSRRVPARFRDDRGYAMAALLVSVAVMGILASVAMPVWRQAAQREKEAELIFRAGQYAHAIEKFKRKYANQYPPDVDILINQRFLRKKYKDPMTKDGEWRIVTPSELQGVAISNVPGATTPGAGGVNNGRTTFSGPQPGGPGAGSPPTSPQGSSGSSSSFAPGAGQSSFGINSPGGRTVNVGPIAAVQSKSTQQSIRIFKGRDRYNQWLVTIEDVMPRSYLRPQQPGQPGQGPGRGNQPGSSRPGASSPGLGQPGSSSPPRR